VRTGLPPHHRAKNIIEDTDEFHFGEFHMECLSQIHRVINGRIKSIEVIEIIEYNKYSEIFFLTTL
jgi:hypothetical protein